LQKQNLTQKMAALILSFLIPNSGYQYVENTKEAHGIAGLGLNCFNTW